MTKDTRTLAKACRVELIVPHDEAAIEVAWKKTVQTIEYGGYFSYTLEPTSDGNTKVLIWPFAVHSGDKESCYLDLQMLDLPDADSFVEKTFMPFKKTALKKLCVLCMTRSQRNDPLRILLMVDSRAGKEKTEIFTKAYSFCAKKFRDAYAAADARIFTPARIMDEISMSLADNLC